MDRFDSNTKVEAYSKGSHGMYRLEGEHPILIKQANQFLSAAQARGMSPTTIRAYAFDLVIIIRWLGRAQTSIEHMEEKDLLDFISAERSRKSKARSINRRLATMGSFYRFITGRPMRRGPGVFAPTPYYRGRGYERQLGLRHTGRASRRELRVQVPHDIIEPLRPEQINAFLKSLDRYRDVVLVYLMLLCGLRSSEVLAVEVKDIDPDNGTVCVQGKGNRQRMVPLPPPVSTALAAYLRLERPRRCHTDRVFVTLQGHRRGCAMTPAGLRSLFRWRRKDPSLHNANPHRFRHTFGTDMARAGLRLPVLQRLMGHCDMLTTLRYINLSMRDVVDEFQRATERLGKRYET